MKSSALGTKKFTTEMQRATRGAAAGSGVFRGMGRSIAFASGAFIGFAGIGEVIRKSTDAAREAGVSQRQLATQVNQTGASFKAWRPLIEQADERLRRLSGFKTDELESSLTILVRSTGNVNAALKLNRIATDVARGAHKNLATVALALGKAYDGQTGALRRLGIVVPKTATGMEAIRIVAERFRGQAKAGTTTLDRFSSAINKLEITLGKAILPLLNRLAERATRWINRMEASGRLKEDVQRLANAVRRAGNAIEWTARKAGELAGKVGGWKNLIAGVIGAWAGFKAAGVGAAVAVQAANIAAAFEVSSAWKAALITTGWGAFAVAAGIAASYAITHWAKVKAWFEEFWIWLQESGEKAFLKVIEPFSHIPDNFLVPGALRNLGQWARGTKDQVKGDLKTLERMAAQVVEAASRPAKVKGPKLPEAVTAGGLFAGRGVSQATAASVAAKAAAAREKQRQLAERLKQLAEKREQARLDRLQFAVDKAQATAGQADDLRALNQLAAFLKRRIGVERGNLDLQRQLLSVQQQITDIHRQQAQERQRQAVLAAQRRVAREQAAQFRLLGLDPTGSPLIPGAQALRKQLVALQRRLAGTLLGAQKEGLLANISKVLSGRFGKVRKDVRQSIEQILADLRQQLADVASTATGSAAGLGTTVIPPRMAVQYGLAGAAPAAAAGFGGTNYHINNLVLSGVQNVSQLENELQKRTGQRAQARRGPS